MMLKCQKPQRDPQAEMVKGINGRSIEWVITTQLVKMPFKMSGTGPFSKPVKNQV